MGNSELNGLSEPKRYMREALDVYYKAFVDEFGKTDQTSIEDFSKYLLRKVVIVVVKTVSLASGFRLFNIINARGMQLSNADLLKSENLRLIPEDTRPRYTKMWEDIEEGIGSDDLEMLMSFIRSIWTKRKAKGAIFEEFEERVFQDPENPDFKGKRFVDYLEKIASLYKSKIQEPSNNWQNAWKEVRYHNLVCLMRYVLPFNDWMAVIIHYAHKFPGDSSLADFTVQLEKKVAVEWIVGLSFTERLTRIFGVIEVINKADDPKSVLNDPVFDLSAHRDKLVRALDDVYLYSRGRGTVPKYALLRLDLERYDGLHKKMSYVGEITVEHVLPQTPVDVYWTSRFNEATRLEWTNKLGNLAPLNGRKNSQASNRPFPEKVHDYFVKKSDFDITNELKDCKDWSLKCLEQRHNRLREDAVAMWIGR